MWTKNATLLKLHAYKLHLAVNSLITTIITGTPGYPHCEQYPLHYRAHPITIRTNKKMTRNGFLSFVTLKYHHYKYQALDIYMNMQWKFGFAAHYVHVF